MSEGSADLLSFVQDLAVDGERPAVVALVGGKPVTVSRAELSDVSLRLAAGLLRRGLGAGQPVAIVTANSMQAVILRLALGALGAVAVALDETLPDDALAADLAASGARLIFASPAQAARLDKLLPVEDNRLFQLDRAGQSGAAMGPVPSWLSLLAPSPGELLGVDSSAPAILVRAAGLPNSTGVTLSQSQLVAGAGALAAARVFEPGDRVLLSLPLAQVYALSVGLYGVLASGGAMLLPEAVAGRQVRQAIVAAEATAVIGVPALYGAWPARVENRATAKGAAAARWFALRRALSRRLLGRFGPNATRHLFPDVHGETGPVLRTLVSGADRLERGVARELGALGWQVIDGYTLSEVAGFAAVSRPFVPSDAARSRPLPGCEIRIVDPGEDGLGEIALRGPQVAGEGDGDGWLHSGDLGRLDDKGRLELAGRSEERITLDGRSLFAAQLEAVYGDTPVIREIVVLARDGALHACVLPDLDAIAGLGGARVEDVLRVTLGERARHLPRSHALSDFAVLRDPLPRGALGRLRRELIPALYERSAGQREAPIEIEPSQANRELAAMPRIGNLGETERRWIAPPGAGSKVLGAGIYGILRPLIRLFFRLRIEGLDNLPSHGGFVIVANHVSNLDPFIVAASLPLARFRRNYWGGEAKRVSGSRLSRVFARALRIFPLDEWAPDVGLACAAEVVTSGRSLTWFPEGWCSPDGELQRFLPGIGLLVVESGVPVVPVRITGSFEAMPQGRRLPRPRRVRIVYGEAIEARELIARASGLTDYDGIAGAIRTEVAKLPGGVAHGAARLAARAPLGLRLRWLGEAAAAWTAYGVFRVLPLDAASGLCGYLARSIGPHLGISRKARHNLVRAFPEHSAVEIDAIVRGMWDNLGRSVGEFTHLGDFKTTGPDARIELVGRENIELIKRDGKPGIAFAAHLGNWELAALVAALHELPLSLIYRQANNPYVERLIQHCRGPHRTDYVAKGANASQRIAEAMRSGGHLGMLVDQKTNNGVPAPFFGRDAMTTPVLALCALNYDCPLLPAQVERLDGARFRVTVHPPLYFTPSGDKDGDRRAVTAQVNAMIEDWVRQRPAQWLWLHRRWSD